MSMEGRVRAVVKKRSNQRNGAAPVLSSAKHRYAKNFYKTRGIEGGGCGGSERARPRHDRVALTLPREGVAQATVRGGVRPTLRRVPRARAGSRLRSVRSLRVLLGMRRARVDVPAMSWYHRAKPPDLYRVILRRLLRPHSRVISSTFKGLAPANNSRRGWSHTKEGITNR